MRTETRAHLADAREAAAEIREIGSEAHLESRRDALAIQRLFEIVGEALVRIREDEPHILDSITDAYAIIGMRNVIAHGYDAIDPRRIAATIKERVPALVDELDKLLAG